MPAKVSAAEARMLLPTASSVLAAEAAAPASLAPVRAAVPAATAAVLEASPAWVRLVSATTPAAQSATARMRAWMKLCTIKSATLLTAWRNVSWPRISPVTCCDTLEPTCSKDRLYSA